MRIVYGRLVNWRCLYIETISVACMNTTTITTFIRLHRPMSRILMRVRLLTLMSWIKVIEVTRERIYNSTHHAQKKKHWGQSIHTFTSPLFWGCYDVLSVFYRVCGHLPVFVFWWLGFIVIEGTIFVVIICRWQHSFTNVRVPAGDGS